jgi:signal peptidase II
VVWFWAIAVVGCASDLLSKHWVFRQGELLAGNVWWLWEGHAGLQLSLNEGALFGMGQGKTWLFALCSVAAGIAIPIWLFRFRAAVDPLLTLALACVMGGVFGNLYDRLGWHGLQWGQFTAARVGEPVYAVRDFLLLAWRWDIDPGKRIVWPNFNVADMLLVCGACLMLLLSLRPIPSPSPPSTAA